MYKHLQTKFMVVMRLTFKFHFRYTSFIYLCMLYYISNWLSGSWTGCNIWQPTSIDIISRSSSRSVQNLWCILMHWRCRTEDLSETLKGMVWCKSHVRTLFWIIKTNCDGMVQWGYPDQNKALNENEWMNKKFSKSWILLILKV